MYLHPLSPLISNSVRLSYLLFLSILSLFFTHKDYQQLQYKINTDRDEFIYSVGLTLTGQNKHLQSCRALLLGVVQIQGPNGLWEKAPTYSLGVGLQRVEVLR